MILRGDSSGQFESAANFAAPNCAHVTVGDVDGDGLGDIVVADDDGLSLRLFTP